MALKKPIAVYTAATNAEAQLIQEILNEAGIEAFAVEDTSPVGMYSLGVVSQIHKPQVWVERNAAEQAREIINKYEKQPASKRKKKGKEFCYGCGEAVQRGAARCPACEVELDWSEDAKDPGTFDTVKVATQSFAWLFIVPFLFVILVLFIAAMVVSVFVGR